LSASDKKRYNRIFFALLASCSAFFGIGLLTWYLISLFYQTVLAPFNRGLISLGVATGSSIIAAVIVYFIFWLKDVNAFGNKIVIKGTRVNGDDFRKKVESNILTISFFQDGLSQVDLSPLKNCLFLQKLYLNNNHFSEINLTSLRECDQLQVLKLSDNQFSKINLTPLSECKELEELYLENNPLSKVDISPLRVCYLFTKLSLDSSTKILWEGPPVSSDDLPKGLEEYQAQIKKAGGLKIPKKNQ
jgi:hypothetical protein